MKKAMDTVTGLLRQIREIFSLNIGTVVFGLLLIYMIFGAVMYLSSSHIETYQVISGPLSRNETYTGLSVREETVCKASTGGFVNYYAREGSKINAGGVVYGLSSTPIPESTAVLSSEDMARIRSNMMSFSRGFNPSKFNTTYNFKYQLEGSIFQYVGVTAQASPSSDVQGSDGEEGSALPDSTANVVILGNQTLVKSEYDGIVLYSKDGYEGKTVENLTAEDFNQNNYHKTDLKTTDMVSPGDDIYTIITDERWILLIPLTDKQVVRLRDRSSIRVKFLKDDMTQTGDLSVIEVNGVNYGQLVFYKGLIRYASDRFLDIELVTNSTSGLKIPLTSIVTKEFYIIPSDFAYDQETAFYVEQKEKDGTVSRKKVTPTIYASLKEEDTSYASTDSSGSGRTWLYVDKSAFQKGDVLLKENSQEKFAVGETDVLEGVYCINQGYAVFRRIVVLDQNEEYAIVSRDTNYGLVRYDHIVRDAKDVKEQDILY